MVVTQGVRVGETAASAVALSVAQAARVNVEGGCALPDPCDSGPCPPHSYCSDDWDSFSCRCHPGECPGTPRTATPHCPLGTATPGTAVTAVATFPGHCHPPYHCPQGTATLPGPPPSLFPGHCHPHHHPQGTVNLPGHCHLLVTVLRALPPFLSRSPGHCHPYHCPQGTATLPGHCHPPR